MAVFDLRCTSCKAIQQDVVLAANDPIPSCPCGAACEKVWDHAPAGHVFKAGMFEHLGIEPVYAGSKSQLKAECKERGLFSPYAWD